MNSFEQETLWEFCRASRAKSASVNNMVGPFECSTAESNRDFGCKRYDDCLSVSATASWQSFTCDGCQWALVKDSVKAIMGEF